MNITIHIDKLCIEGIQVPVSEENKKAITKAFLDIINDAFQEEKTEPRKSFQEKLSEKMGNHG